MSKIDETHMGWDLTDTPQERQRGATPVHRAGVRIPAHQARAERMPDTRPAARGRLPGVPGQPEPRKKGIGVKNEVEGWDEIDWDVIDSKTGQSHTVKGRNEREVKQRLAGQLYKDPDLWASGQFDAWPASKERPKRMATRGPDFDDELRRTSDLARSGALTHARQFIGTPKYASPEQHLNRDPTPDDIEFFSARDYELSKHDGRGGDQRASVQGRVGPRTEPLSQPNDTRPARPMNMRQKADESSVGGSLMGFQAPIEDDQKNEHRLVTAIRGIVREIVRKKQGGGGYVLYSPNKKKKKNPKPVGEFPSRIAAKKAELARFPPKDAEQLKRARKRLDKLAKDPKKRAAAERDELSVKPKGRTRKPSGKRAKGLASKAKKESFSPRPDPIREMALTMSRELSEALFREDDVPGSPWDERLSSLSPEHLAADKRLHGLHKGVEKGSLTALMSAQKGLGKALKKIGKLNPGEPAFDQARRKHFMPCMLDCDGDEIGPIHLYIDGGHVKIEVSQEARRALAGLDPEMSSDFRGRLVSFQEDELPYIEDALDAVAARDAYLDKLNDKLDVQFSQMTPVQLHLAKSIMNQRRRR